MYIEEIDKALNDVAASIRSDLINSLNTSGKVATGQTEKQITITRSANSVSLNLPAYITMLETGRGPTGKNAVQANPPLIQRIRQWCQAKGISDKAAWPIKKKIDKFGYKGKPGIISQPLSNTAIEANLQQPLQTLADSITSQIITNIPA